MSTTIREFTEQDIPLVASMIHEFQNYLVSVDDLKLLPEFTDKGAEYTALMLQKVKEHDGVVYVAMIDDSLVGLVATTVEESSREDALLGTEHMGRVVELYVHPSQRKTGLGKQLLQKAESYLQSKGCTQVSIEVLASNTNAHEFYNHLGYTDRAVELLKILK